ncbi:MAG TPA: glyoxylate/hydroxypyruvate reductase A [Ramlibacter sp.]|nr:glyoxylate/hydroxypyruvate reductase A [Ramlibacter sp.]
MAILVNPMSGEPAVWRAELARALPGETIYLWPEVGPAADIEFAFVAKMPVERLGDFPNLKLVGSLVAGVDHLLAARDLPKVPFVRTAAPGGDAMITEFALLHVLRHHRQLPQYQALQAQRVWQALPQKRAEERTVGLMGLGTLGAPTATALAGLGFQVAGWSRRPKAIDGVGSFAEADLHPFLARSEILVNLLPLTPSTQRILNRETLLQLPAGASIVNLGRGGHVDTAALLELLDSGHLSHATLDVFDEEPLPKDSPLWAHPKVTITPHVARRQRPADLVAQIARTLDEFRAGRDLSQRIDFQHGY